MQRETTQKILTKKDLYAFANDLRERLSPDPGQIDVCSLCDQMSDTAVCNVAFKTPGLRGMAVIGRGAQRDIILLNSALRPIERNFYCAHELVHLKLHRDVQMGAFHCFDLSRPQSDNYLEWQANEGAAQLIMPHRSFIDAVLSRRHMLQAYHSIAKLRIELAELYLVTPAMVKVRMESLRYELAQALDGVPLDEVEILSLKHQQQRGIDIQSIPALEQQLFLEELRRRGRGRNISVYK